MMMKTIRQGLMAICLLTTVCLAGCQTSTGTTDTENAGNRSLAPRRVDVRGSIIMSRYNEGQVMLEVEGFPSQDSRFNRAYVLVEPITQITDINGNSISLSELRQGQNVAILLRGGGNGNLVGVGVARRIWLEQAQ